jgi:Matrixin
MARRPSVGELLLCGAVVVLVTFIATQVVASPRRLGAKAGLVLSGRDSVAIAEQYRSQIAERRGAYSVPPWLADIQIARLQAAAARDVAGYDAEPDVSADSVRALIAAGEAGSYLVAMLAEDRGIVTRWRSPSAPIRVWVQPHSTEPGFSPELISPTRRAFTAWNEVALPAMFEMVEDSTAADVHVTWSARMPEAQQLGTTFRMTGGTGWIAFAHVILSTAYDIYTVQNAARHEAGHALGLGHSPNGRDIMAAATQGRQVYLTDADRLTATWLYHLPPGSAR